VAYDEQLADRIRDVLAPREAVSEREMFGGIAFMVGGNMACGVNGDELVVRLEPDEAERALDEDAVRPFDIIGRPMKGWIAVSPDATAAYEDLTRWVEAGAAFAASLPRK
jgi:TfoX/Sxy family transcriptional regulator of competence genes